MESKSVAVVMKAREPRIAFTQGFMKEEAFELVGTAEDGDEGLLLIREKKPDAVLMNLMLPVRDGFEILEHLQREVGYDPSVYIITAAATDDVFRRAIAMGALYCFSTPMMPEKVIERMKCLMGMGEEKGSFLGQFLAEGAPAYDPGMVICRDEFLPLPEQNEVLYEGSQEEKGAREELQERIVAYGSQAKKKDVAAEKYFFLRGVPDQDVSLILQGMNMPHLGGYWYIRESVVYAIEKPEVLQNVSARLFPVVASKWNTTGEKVDRSIRNSIDVAWGRKSEKNLIFWSFLGYPDKRPSVKRFICALTDKLLMYYEYRGV